MPTDHALRLAPCWLCLLAIGCGGGSINALIAQLNDSDPQVRRSAAEALGDHANAAATVAPALERTLVDSDQAVRLSAALALQRIDATNTRLRPIVLESLEAGDAPLLLEVGQMGRNADWTVPTLVKLLSHPQPQIRALAAQALGQIGVSEEVEQSLKQRLRDPNAAVRKAALRALDAAPTPSSTPSD